MTAPVSAAAADGEAPCGGAPNCDCDVRGPKLGCRYCGCIDCGAENGCDACVAEPGVNPGICGCGKPGAAPDVAGTLALGAAVKSIPEGTTIYVIARPAGALRGPPIAAARLSATAFPMRFVIGPENSMTGAPFPDKALLQARVDFDGDPMTRDPGEPSAILDGVARGATEVRLVLAPPSAAGR
jgi:hypothetical protein